MLILCMVFFLLPFALRGARLAVTSMQNNVADWLPGDYEETKELAEFRKYFIGDQFVVVSGPWCYEGNDYFKNLRESLRRESLEYEPVLKQQKRTEEIRAHRKGDELGLLYTGNYHEDWVQNSERWLLGKRGQWYWIDRQGRLFRWDGQNNVIQGASRFIERMLHGRNIATGTYIDRFGPPPSEENNFINPFYQDPTRICARPFKSVTSGPEVFEKMAGPNGTIRIGPFEEGDESAFLAKVEAHNRLTGAMFGATPPSSFQWSFDSLLQHINDPNKLRTIKKDQTHYRQLFEKYLDKVIQEDFDGEFENLLAATVETKLELWYRIWEEAFVLPQKDQTLERSTVGAPPRQTCLIVTLNEPILGEMDRAVGRPLLGKPRGRILDLAIGNCEIPPEHLHLGGPPSDNVAIDEEGTSTLLRLVSLSLIIGLTLAYLSFRSIPVTGMLFFVGGVSAIASLSYVWFAGSTLDAILMSMPSLVYVLGLSGAVHIVNYYRDACHSDGPEAAVETAIKHGWFPCTLAAFTTALGLISLYTSNLTPIKKFGFFSAIAVMATVVLLFTYLPAALTIWSPGYKRRVGDAPEPNWLAQWVTDTWNKIGEWVIKRHAFVAIATLLLMGFLAYGITKVETSVQLLKLFDSKSKILEDYRWMEANLGKLVPMELVVTLDEDLQKEVWLKKQRDRAKAAAEKRALANGTPMPKDDEFIFDYDKLEYDLKYSVLERMELSQRVRKQLEKFFGPDGLNYVGSGMSTDVFAPMQIITTQHHPSSGLLKISNTREWFNEQLQNKKQLMLEQDYLAVAGQSNLDVIEAMADRSDPDVFGREMWRISIRLAALNDVDYGDFVASLKTVVEPIMTAYRFRTEILKAMQESELGEKSLTEGKILVFGRNPDNLKDKPRKADPNLTIQQMVDQTFIFSDTLQDLLENRGYVAKGASEKKYNWVDPETFKNPELSEAENESKKDFPEPDKLELAIKNRDCVILIEDHPLFDVEFIKKHAKNFIDCRNHKFELTADGKLPKPGMTTAMQDKRAGKDVEVATIYTGIIPIVYKAQNQLLRSLINSIALAFVMIAFVMMLLLRNWNRPVGPGNVLNVSGGMLSMLPNVFPILLIFGTMGHIGRKVDIGSMMTASVAMGVAVDDTIHFLNWYRQGLAKGLSRHGSIRLAYERVATAMTQTTLIGGFGLSAFALSTFTPTQRFGVLMLFLLAAALIGDLIFLPALLAGPLGRFFGKELSKEEAAALEAEKAAKRKPKQDVTESSSVEGGGGKRRTFDSGSSGKMGNRLQTVIRRIHPIRTTQSTIFIPTASSI